MIDLPNLVSVSSFFGLARHFEIYTEPVCANGIKATDGNNLADGMLLNVVAHDHYFCHEVAMVVFAVDDLSPGNAVEYTLGLQSCQGRRYRECSATRELSHIPALAEFKDAPNRPQTRSGSMFKFGWPCREVSFTLKNGRG